MKGCWRILALLIGLAQGLAALAAGPAGVFRIATPVDLDQAYERIYKALEAQQFWVVFEANMGQQMERRKEALGADYNRNGLGAIRAMVFCNVDWTNAMANADPDLLALCPLHLTLFERDGRTQVVMPRPSVLAKGSAGEPRAAELEAVIRGIVERALRGP